MTLDKVKAEIEWLIECRKQRLFLWAGRKGLKEKYIMQGELKAYENVLEMLNEIDSESEEDDDDD